MSNIDGCKKCQGLLGIFLHTLIEIMHTLVELGDMLRDNYLEPRRIAIWRAL